MAHIPQEIIKLLDPNGFNEEVYKHQSTSKTVREAYEKAESVFFEWFGYNRYYDYTSYITNRHKHIKKLLKKQKV